MKNIAAILQTQAQTQPHVPAIIDPRKGCLSFAELELAASRAAALLHQSGLRSSDAALVFQPMSAELYVALMALFRLGMVAMFVDPSAGVEYLDRCCALSPPQALIASSKAHLLRFKSAALQRIPHKFAIGFPVLGAQSWSKAKRLLPHEEIIPCDADTPALLTFTSGSTGQPKAALRTHGFLLAQHRALAASLQLAPGQIDLTTLPIFVLANLASGVTSLIPDADLRFPGKINAAKVMAQIQTYQPQSTAASPAFLERLANYCDQHNLQLTSFQRIFSGGAPVFPRLLERLQSLAPQSEITAVYGSTEAEPIAHITYHQIQADDRAAMSQGSGLLVGVPVPEIQLQILPYQWGKPIGALTGNEFAAIVLPPGEAGEIVVSGDHVLPGYLHGYGDEETKFRVDGIPWHRTGDAGYRDEHGRLWLLGRCSVRIEDEHGILYPFAVEVAVSQYSQIQRSAILQHQKQRLLVIEFAASMRDQSQEQQEVLERLKRSLAWAKIQDDRILHPIPVDKRHNAKIDYPALYKVLK